MSVSAFPSRQVRTDKFLRSMCQGSYYQFFLEFWPIIAAEKLNPAWYIRELCNELQIIAERVFVQDPKEYDLIWNTPPGTTKSSVVSVGFQPWLWTRMPSLRSINGSYADRLALDLSRKSRDVVLSDKYQHLFPEIKLREDQNTKGYYANSFGGMRYSVGVGGSVIGMHGHIISVDDPIDPLGSLSDLILAESNTWINETLSRRKVNIMTTPLILIMQRLHQDDPTGNLLARARPGRIKHFILPGEDSWEIKPESFTRFYEEGLLDPVRLPREGLNDAIKELGEIGYACQIGQQPVPRGGALFKVDRLRYETTPPLKWKRGPVRYWDRAGTKDGGTFTAGVKVGLDLHNQVWVLDVVRDQWDSGERERMIDRIAQQDGRKVRIGQEQEPGSSGKDVANANMKRLTLKKFRVLNDKVTGDKEHRAQLFSQHVNCGNVIILVGDWNKTFVEEMRFFPRSKYKDQIDAGSGGVNALIKPKYRIGVL
jgi:predicted phage terminase large subunit-like protein